MLKNFITIALRQFRRNLSYSIINILGLSLGLAGSFVIGSWVWQELNFDRHYQDSNRIHRVSVSFFNSGAFARGPEILNNVLAEQAPEVEIATRVENQRTKNVYVDDRTFEIAPLGVDSTFFKIFDHHFISGNSEAALAEPNNIVISTDLANKLFGTDEVYGNIVEIGEEKTPYTISGVILKSENPTHLETDLWMPIELEGSDNWLSSQYFDYVKLSSGTSKEDLERRLELIRKDLVYPTFNSGMPYEDWVNSGNFGFYVKPLTDIHLDPPMKFDLQAGGNRANVYVFLMVTIFLLVIAVINFVNLSTAQSAKRAKEVGVRKAMGTSRKSLIIQYLTESVLVSLVALFVGVGLSEIFLILFQSFTNEKLINGLFSGWFFGMVYFGFGLVVGVLAGIYPAFYLSSFKPVDILKSKIAVSGRGAFRNFLVVFQFTISIALIICSVIVYNQLDYLRTADLGFDRENVLVINNADLLGEYREAFKQKLLQHNAVKTASFNKRTPAGQSLWLYVFKTKEMERGIGLQTFIGDDQYLETVGFRLLEGRNFSKEIASDSTALILTESAVKELMLGDNAIGTELNKGYHVIGVVSDFSFKGFDEKPEPVAIIQDTDGYRLSIRLQGNQEAEFIEYLNAEWQALSLDDPLNYAFIDDNFEQLMEKEKTLGKTIAFFTSIAIFISCLGLFGLAAFTTEQRQKEIGIRKVLGASVSTVVLLLNKGFTKLVAISVLISVPLAWYLMDQWLQNFQYKTDINIAIFILSGFAAMFIAWLTVSYLSIVAAAANPVDTLRNE
ncbi:ABC transporter permease [Fulvivirga lutimaris]|uniref:ABC transporter permease n=1 Tax=Fulvivirga lutimaris TaxID=1819566 RepID=UPI0012BD4FD9|nr:ABC transporter permease [Fulvivirga lutimaris]MTI40162.1 FtsX-like permease family protein [Fulvivirga lutimaris]